MKKAIIYIHGKGGFEEEAEHYKPLFPECKVIGFDYHSETPWDAKSEFTDYFQSLTKEFDKITIIANSIGAFYTIHSLNDFEPEKVYFISPIVNMEKLITDIIKWAGVTEMELQEKGTIKTSFGEDLSWKYLVWVRKHHVSMNCPTAILYGRRDNLQSIDTIQSFADKFGASLTVMENGEHWFHTEEQMQFVDKWIRK